MSYISCIETANPDNKLSQEQYSDFYCNTITNNNVMAKRKIKAIAFKSGIKNRFSVIPDFTLPSNQFQFFSQNNSLEPIVSLSQRMANYKKEALQLSLKAITNIENFDAIKQKITHLITVTCTGLFAPGLDIELINTLELNPTTHRSSINFMGCNAAILALKQAHYISQSQDNAVVLIVCTELCTIHFQKNYSDDYLLSNLLFSDGSAACIVSSKHMHIHQKYKAFKLENFQSLIIPEGKKDMAWKLSETGFMVDLTSEVSLHLNSNLPSVIKKMTIHHEINHWAIHPGGKRILDDFCKEIKIPKDTLSASYKTLEECGNMSSPTILFVLKKMIETFSLKKNETIFTAAFGPGLSIESALLTIV